MALRSRWRALVRRSGAGATDPRGQVYAAPYRWGCSLVAYRPDRLLRWGGQPLPLNASCWLHDDSDSPDGRDLLFVRLRGAVAAVEAAARKMLLDAPPAASP